MFLLFVVCFLGCMAKKLISACRGRVSWLSVTAASRWFNIGVQLFVHLSIYTGIEVYYSQTISFSLFIIDDFHIVGFYLYHVISISQSRLTATSGLIRKTFDYRFCMY